MPTEALWIALSCGIFIASCLASFAAGVKAGRLLERQETENDRLRPTYDRLVEAARLGLAYVDAILEHPNELPESHKLALRDRKIIAAALRKMGGEG